MENRLKGLDDMFFEKEPEFPVTDLELGENEQLFHVHVDIVLDEEFEDEELDEDPITVAVLVREREFETFAKILNYNKVPYRVEPLR